jgi:hypothetical protein
MKIGFALSVSIAIISIVALIVLWGFLAAGGVFDSVGNVTTTVLGTSSAQAVTGYFGFDRVVMVGLVLGIVDVVLFTALATIGALLYNLIAASVGGLEASLSEEL